MKYNSENLLIKPNPDPRADLILEINPKSAGWDLINFQARRLCKNQVWNFETGPNELALIVFSGNLSVNSNKGNWPSIGKRENVFTGAAGGLYLSLNTNFSVTAQTDCEFAVTWVAATKEYAPFMIDPIKTEIMIRGGDNVSRQINNVLPPGSPVEKLVLVEVYTPGGNWSSYPPHKHDRVVKENEKLLEADLEEIYFYKIDKKEGYAYQRIYTDQSSPLHQRGFPIDALICARDNHAVLVPEGYHPVVSAPGYTSYYLNVLAGSHQSLAASDDPKYAWVKETYNQQDSRVPLY
jgi:5-deoxy-glucuronate isomerase